VIRRQRVLEVAPFHWSTRCSKRIRIILEERRQFYRSICSFANAECIVDSGKEVTFGAMMTRLDSIDFSTIHLVRDPRGVAFSWLKRVRSDSEPRDMPRSPAAKTARRWVSSNLFVQLSLRMLSAAYIRVRYEDLVTHPDDIACKIIHATSHPATPNGRMHNRVQCPHGHHLVGSNPGVRRHLGSDLRLTLDDEWRTHLPRAQQWLVTAVCSSLMAVYGYPLLPRDLLSRNHDS
jgi:hypothetical protein